MMSHSKVQNNSRETKKYENNRKSSGPCYSMLWIVGFGILISIAFQLWFVYFCENCSIGHFFQRSESQQETIQVKKKKKKK